MTEKILRRIAPQYDNSGGRPQFSVTPENRQKLPRGFVRLSLGLAAALIIIYDKGEKTMWISDKNKSVYYVGRFKEIEGGFCCSWSGSSVIAGFEGTGISVKLKSTAADDAVNVSVDKEAPYVLNLESDKESYVLADGLALGKHSVRIEKRIEGKESVLSFLGFDYMGGAPAEAPEPSNIAIEIIGDSISAGYGNEGSIDIPGFRHSEENAAKTYGALAAKQLGAEAVIIGWSGMGVYRDLGGGSQHLMPELFLRTLSEEKEKWNFKDYTPIAVVINLGTNDFAGTKNLNTSEFVDTYIDFIREIRALYPETAILCVMGTIIYEPAPYVQEAVERVNASGDKNVYYYAFGKDENEPIGADGHPSSVTHARMAKELEEQIRKNL